VVSTLSRKRFVKEISSVFVQVWKKSFLFQDDKTCDCIWLQEWRLRFFVHPHRLHSE
jgi:hypothetical protein